MASSDLLLRRAKILLPSHGQQVLDTSVGKVCCIKHVSKMAHHFTYMVWTYELCYYILGTAAGRGPRLGSIIK